MYQDQLLAEYRAPQNRRSMSDSSGRAEKKNPMCGDAITVMVRVADNHINDVSFTGSGCSIAVASASLMTQSVCCLGVPDAIRVMDAVEAMLAEGGGGNGGTVRGQTAGPLPDVLTPLCGVAPFPARHGCALMPWQALREALHDASRVAPPDPVVGARTFR